jgi:hypothetical protein
MEARPSTTIALESVPERSYHDISRGIKYLSQLITQLKFDDSSEDATARNTAVILKRFKQILHPQGLLNSGLRITQSSQYKLIYKDEWRMLIRQIYEPLHTFGERRRMEQDTYASRRRRGLQVRRFVDHKMTAEAHELDALLDPLLARAASLLSVKELHL